MISILIPTYNYDITALVNELHRQALQLDIAFEIVVLDDASTEVPITEKNKSILMMDCCRYIQLETNQGRTYARNNLAREAVYDTLLFLDADVLPKNETFLKGFMKVINKADIAFGGIEYTTTPPKKDEILRWKYGKSREARSLSKRNEQPYLSVISGCSLIRKDVFLKANNFLENRYGLDVLFTYNLTKLQAHVLHIDNPVIHYGLEDNKTFIEKTKKAMESIAYFEKEGFIPNDFRPIQKAYLKLKKWRLAGAFYLMIKLLYSFIEKKLLSAKPSLFLFDLYRLHYFISIKKNMHA